MIFYTYLWLREDGSPYYVGKGCEERAFRKGSPPIARIITQEWVSEEQAFEAEKFLIAYYGRKNNGTGILRNLTDGGEGSAGLLRSEEYLTRNREIQKAVHNLPAVKKRSSLAQLEAQNRPEVKAHRRITAKAWQLRPELKDKHRLGCKRVWEDVDYKERILEQRLLPEERARRKTAISAGMIRYWAERKQARA